MRRDMAKKLVERPRGGAGWKRKRKYRVIDDGSDARHELIPKHEPMSMGRGSKYFGENLAPLRRFLRRRVGVPWDQVYSEIRAQISPKSTVHLHILQHLMHMVERRPVMIDGIPHHPYRYGGGFVQLSGYTRDCLYVCPETGLLRVFQRRRKRPRPR